MGIVNHPYIQWTSWMYGVRYVIVRSPNTAQTPKKFSPLEFKKEEKYSRKSLCEQHFSLDI